MLTRFFVARKTIHLQTAPWPQRGSAVAGYCRTRDQCRRQYCQYLFKHRYGGRDTALTKMQFELEYLNRSV